MIKRGLNELMGQLPPEKLGALLSLMATRKEVRPELFSKGYREMKKKPDMYKQPYKGYYR